MEKTLVDERTWRQTASESCNDCSASAAVFFPGWRRRRLWGKVSANSAAKASLAQASHLVVWLASSAHSARHGETRQFAAKRTRRTNDAGLASHPMRSRKGRGGRGSCQGRTEDSSAADGSDGRHQLHCWRDKFNPWVRVFCLFSWV